MGRSRCLEVALLLSGVVVGGCGIGGGGFGGKTTLQSDAFYKTLPANQTTQTETRQAAADKSGAIPNSVYRPEGPNAAGPVAPTAAQQASSAQPKRVTAISPAVRDTITATSTPTTAPAGLVDTTGGYLTLGAVVTEVSGTPIYADKVVQMLTPLLSAEAKQRDLNAYKALAAREIDKQVRVMITNELETTAAKQNLSKEEQDLAWQLTAMWRKSKITEAGGSEELARRKSAAQGWNFDEQAEEENRANLVKVFYQKKIWPKVQVTAEEIRQYYDRHLKTDYTEVDQAQFRIIKISPKSMGGREQAIDKIKDLREQALRGDDFEKLASSINHDASLMRSGGRVGGGDGWIQRGAFAITEIEEAVWKLQPGEVTEVLEVGDSFYIAKLENRKLGRVRSFEDQAVQEEIRGILTRQQMNARREQEQMKLLKDSVIYPNPPITDPALQIALQKYAAWSTKAP